MKIFFSSLLILFSFARCSLFEDNSQPQGDAQLTQVGASGFFHCPSGLRDFSDLDSDDHAAILTSIVSGITSSAGSPGEEAVNGEVFYFADCRTFPEEFNFSDQSLSQSFLRGSSMPQAKFSGANLTEVSFESADLSEGKFAISDTGRITELTHVILKNANLNHSDFRLAELINVDFTEAKMLNADLRRTTLEHVVFNRTNVGQAKFDLAIIGSGTNLESAINLTAEQLKDAIIHCEAKLPTGPTFSSLQDSCSSMDSSFACSDNGNGPRPSLIEQSNGTWVITEGDTQDPIASIDAEGIISMPNFGDHLRASEQTNLAACRTFENYSFTYEEEEQVFSVFSNFNFNGVNFLGSHFDNVDFTDSSFNGANFREAKFDRGVVKNVELNEANLRGAEIKGTKFLEAYFVRSDFSQSKIGLFESGDVKYNTKFLNSQGQGSIFQGAELTQTLFSNTNLSGSNFKAATTDKVTFVNVDLSGADFRRADLKRARLLNVDFTNADLHGTLFHGAIIGGGTNFRGAKNLTREQLSHAAYIHCGASLPLTSEFQSLLTLYCGNVTFYTVCNNRTLTPDDRSSVNIINSHSENPFKCRRFEQSSDDNFQRMSFVDLTLNLFLEVFCPSERIDLQGSSLNRGNISFIANCRSLPIDFRFMDLSDVDITTVDTGSRSNNRRTEEGRLQFDHAKLERTWFHGPISFISFQNSNLNNVSFTYGNGVRSFIFNNVDFMGADLTRGNFYRLAFQDNVRVNDRTLIGPGTNFRGATGNIIQLAGKGPIVLCGALFDQGSTLFRNIQVQTGSSTSFSNGGTLENFLSSCPR